MERSTLLKTIGKNIAIQRLMKDTSQKELAELCGKQAGMLSNIEKGNTNLTIHTLYDIAVALNVDIKELFNTIEFNKTQD